jgi:hypothetical protein
MRNRISRPLPTQEERREHWRKHAIEMYERRHEPKEATFGPSLFGIFTLNYDVLDIFDPPAKRVFDVWLKERDDYILWSISYQMNGHGKIDGPMEAERATPTGLKFTANSWAELRLAIEDWDDTQ